MLARSHGYSAGSWANHNCYHADGGGNITYLMTSAQGMAARYRYDPYGRLLSSSGPLAGANLYRFASKEVNPNYPDGGGYYYFGYRFYDPNLQRWLNRDPLGEAGGINLYAYVRNRPTDAVDPLGESDQNRPPIIVIGRPGGPITPVYGPPRPEPGIYPGSGSPHEALDLAGFLDPLGLFDGLNTLLYASEGDWENAGISFCGMIIPYAGDAAAKAGRLGRTFTPDQKALNELVNEITQGGRKPLSRKDAETVLDWAQEVGYPGWRAGPDDVGFPSHWKGYEGWPHIHLPGAGRGGHVPVEPGVKPRCE